MPIFLTWLSNASNVATVGMGSYEGVRAYREKSIAGMGAVAIGLGVIVLLSVYETHKRKKNVSPATQALTVAPTSP